MCKKSIKRVSNYDLLDYYSDAVREDNYNPTSESYNKSNFSLDELKNELLIRLDAAGEYEDEGDMDI